MSFDEVQVEALRSKLSEKNVRQRTVEGKVLSYIEGWRAISEANRIFGFDAWDRVTVGARRIWEHSAEGRYACTYAARVRVTVRAGEIKIVREGAGVGHGAGWRPGEANEVAIKAAETDATKRALATFGNPFGLALYDREQAGVRRKPGPKRQADVEQATSLDPSGSGRGGVEQDDVAGASWLLRDGDGVVVEHFAAPRDFCAALRGALDRARDLDELVSGWRSNEAGVLALRESAPDLRTNSGRHFADLLQSIYNTHLKRLGAGCALPTAAVRVNGSTMQHGDVRTPHLNGIVAAAVRSRSAGDGAEKGNAKDDRQEGRAPSSGVSKTSGPEVAPDVDGSKAPIDKSALAIPALKRKRDKAHLKKVARMACLVCGRTPSDAHHLRFVEPRGLAVKPSDDLTVPLCRTHHSALHRAGDEKLWWEKRGIDPVLKADEFWRSSHAGKS